MEKGSVSKFENPLQQVEHFYNQLLAHYGPGEDREIRAASKLLLVALDKFRQFGGPDWMALVDAYTSMVKHNPEKFDRIMASQRGPG